jgi:hypothetical protein
MQITKNFIHGLRKSQKNDENYRMGRLFYCTVPFLGVPGVFLYTNYWTVGVCTYVALLSHLNNNITSCVVGPEPEPDKKKGTGIKNFGGCGVALVERRLAVRQARARLGKVSLKFNVFKA